VLVLVICSVEGRCEPIVAFPGCLPGYWMDPVVLWPVAALEGLGGVA
jgi:hypothetical protein